MHFSKTYQQLLLTLPPELRDSAIEYRKLKKLINQVVTELASIGLSPEVLHDVLQPTDADCTASDLPLDVINISSKLASHSFHRVYYELSNASDRIEPRLRLRLDTPGALSSAPSSDGRQAILVDDVTSYKESSSLGTSQPCDQTDSNEVIIPLVSDTAFFALLIHALELLTLRLATVRTEFETSLHQLSRSISFSARPVSSTSVFQPSGHSSNPATISVSAPSTFFSSSKSDLYAWREIFQAYVEAEIFESHSERTRGERTVEDAEQRLAVFMQRMNDRGLVHGNALKLRESRQALRTFMELNAFIMDLRKFQHATTEATRKILKKHTKRTALPLAPTLSSPFFISGAATVAPSSALSALVPRSTTSLSVLLGQAIGVMILPVIPHIDDYSCLICTSIAFKPIRLHCGHLFCVRCLVKMQKRGQGDCPMCRAPTVLSADRSNVDWALLNFMKDWFPVESRQKLQQNEREVAQEELEELGIDPRACIVM